MRSLYLYWLAVWLLAMAPASAQEGPAPSGDTTILLRVEGVCEMCKDRIEAAAKGRGVRVASWSMDTKWLTLTYNPTVTSLNKIRYRLLDAGHDVAGEKAKDAIYFSLPECCRYRELSKEEHDSLGMKPPTVEKKVKGVVLEQNDKGEYFPLRGASVYWMGTAEGTMTDSSGVFSIPLVQRTRLLVVSYTGMRADTLAVENETELKVIMATGQQLKEVRVSARQRSMYFSAVSPVRTQVMTEKELFKAACCNLSESFETNPSVDVSYNDAVTGSKQIQLLGLSGSYTQLTVENLPGPRGLATPLGLNFIPGPWVESIQLNKGVGSVANGFESIAGQINVEMKKPETAESFYANAYLNEMGKADLNLVLSRKLGKKWSTSLLLHDNFMTNSMADFNGDGFRDLTTGNLFTALSRWKYDGGNGWMGQFGLKLLSSQLTGGETDFDPKEDKYTTRAYGLGIDIRRYEAFAKIGYVFPEKKFKSVGLQLSAYDHRQDSYFGFTSYDARQRNFYGNLIYQSIIHSTAHKFRTGLSLMADRYREGFNALNFQRTETVPGAFFEYTLTLNDQFGLVAGIRGDHNSLFGWFATPRLHVRYEPVKGTVFRLSAGRGQRTANIFAENASVFVSARQVQLLNAAEGKAYGFDPEVAWNKGISLDQKLRLFEHDAMLSFDFFRNDFTRQVVVDLENVRQVSFYALDGKSYSNSFQAEFSMEPIRKFDVRLAYRFFDVKMTYGDKLLQRPFIARHRAFANLAYEIDRWKFDYTLTYNGSKRIPSTRANPEGFRFPDNSPSYWMMNAQVSKTVGKKRPIDFYLGGENLGNFLQGDAIIGATQPFGPYFDASMIWGPVSGRMFYAGFRYKIK